MKYEVKRIAPGSVLRVVAVTYGLIGAVIGLLSGLFLVSVRLRDTFFWGIPLPEILIVILMMALYGVIAGVIGAVSAWAYNIVAGWVGGIELELQELRPPGGGAPAGGQQPPNG